MSSPLSSTEPATERPTGPQPDLSFSGSDLVEAKTFDVLWTITKREFFSYFRSPVAYVFLAVFLVASIGMTWFIGRFFESDDASLALFFNFLPWVYLFLIPSVGMRLWAEEKRSGTWELLFTYPVTILQAVVSKFLAGWAFIAIALAATFTMPFTLAFLGSPDWGPIFTGYFGAFLLAGAYLSIASLASALTRNQVIGFVLSFILCLVLVLVGWSVFNQLLASMGFPVGLVDYVANLGFLPHFESMVRGLITLGDICFFLAYIVFFLWMNAIVLQR
jgi:ABC-2 type transport system permease protein